MDREVHEIRLKQWEKLIQDANTCGKSKKQWCADNGVSAKQLYYWQRKVRHRAIEKRQLEQGNELPAFATLAPPADESRQIENSTAGAPDTQPVNFSSPFVLCSGGYQLLIGNSVSEQALTAVLRAMKNA